MKWRYWRMSAYDPKRTSCRGARVGICIGLSIAVNPPWGCDMQRRRENREPRKGRRTSGSKAHKASTAGVSTTDLQEQLAALTRELTEAREQLTEALECQTATDEVLNVVSRSPTDAAGVRHDCRKRRAALRGPVLLCLPVRRPAPALRGAPQPHPRGARDEPTRVSRTAKP